MRISFAVERDQTLLWVNKKKEEIARLTNAISSGKKLESPSDAPSLWSRAVELKQGLREYETILENIDFATGWNEATDNALTSVSDALNRARQLAVSANSGDLNEKKDELMSELEEMVKSLVSTANSQYGDQYVFAGTDNSSAPYSFDYSSGELDYSGDTGSVQVRTDRGANGVATVNLTGPDVFDYESGEDTLNVIEEVWDLRRAISEGDTEAIQEKLGTLESAFDHISQQSTVVGTRLSTLETKSTTVQLFKADTEGWLSDVEGADTVEAALKLQQEQTLYQAALQVAAMVDNLSLANFI